MDDMRSADVDFITMGQYLQPTPKHAKVEDFVDSAGLRRLRRDRAGQGLPAGRREPADPLELSRAARISPQMKRGAGGKARQAGLMPGIRETRRVPYSAEQMFDLVADVARYDEFLPWVVGGAGQVRQRNRNGRGSAGRVQGAAREVHLESAQGPARMRSRCSTSTGR